MSKKGREKRNGSASQEPCDAAISTSIDKNMSNIVWGYQYRNVGRVNKWLKNKMFDVDSYGSLDLTGYYRM